MGDGNPREGCGTQAGFTRGCDFWTCGRSNRWWACLWDEDFFGDSCVVGSCIWEVSSGICGGFPTHRGVESLRWRGELVYFEIEMSRSYGQT